MKIFNTKNIKIYIEKEKLGKEDLFMFGIKMYGSRQLNWSSYGIEFFISVFKFELKYLNIKKLNNSLNKNK